MSLLLTFSFQNVIHVTKLESDIDLAGIPLTLIFVILI